MANIAILVPRAEMIEEAKKAAEEQNIYVQQIKQIETPNSVSEAYNAVENGANVIIARGIQAQLIKRNTNVPLVEMKLTGQELGLLVLQAKRLVKKQRPKIAIVGFCNSYSSMTHFESLYDVKMLVCLVNQIEELQRGVEQAAAEEADVIIGGDIVNEAAERLGIPSVFSSSTEESFREALDIADKMGYAIDMEKQAASQLDSILQTSLNGIIRVDTGHKVTAVNQVVRDVMKLSDRELIASPVEQVVPGLETALIDDIMQGRERQGSSSVRIHNNQLMLTAAPIELGEKITGCIITFHHMGNVSPKSEKRLHNMLMKGYVANANFSHLRRSSVQINHTIELAKMYSLSRNPVMIYGEAGTEKEVFAQAIHNNSGRRNHPYVSVSCFESAEEKQAAMLFGTTVSEHGTEQNGALVSANFGTIHIADIDHMTPQCQHRLYRLITKRVLIRNDIDKAMNVDVRIIASAEYDLITKVQEGTFYKELYYLLQSLKLDIPPLRKDPAEIEQIAAEFINISMERYSKYVVLTQNAMEKLKNYSWEGNLNQLEHFCEFLILTANKRTLDEGYVGNLLSNLYPAVTGSQEHARVTVYKHPEALRISKLLEKHRGSRAAVAKEMGVSTTTLWRYMKKYGVE